MDKGMLLVAIGRSRLPGILDITLRQSSVIFGTMDGKALSDFADGGAGSSDVLPVYFYETG